MVRLGANLVRLTKIKSLSDTISVVLGTINVSGSTENKLSVINKRSILEISHSKVVNLILLFKGKGRRPSHIFVFIVILLTKHKHYFNS